MGISVRDSLPRRGWLCAIPGMLAVAVIVPCGPAVAAGDADRSACPAVSEASAGFRSYLPDCRAYEMVTPPYKGDNTVRDINQGQLISPDGLHVVGTSFGGFAGTGNVLHTKVEQNGATYLFSRTPSGWVTEALAPPASQDSYSEPLAMSASFEDSLWSVEEQPKANEEIIGTPGVMMLAIREPGVDGEPARFVDVGPEQPNATDEPGAFVLRGASADLRHVVFSIEVAGEGLVLWPGDTTFNEQNNNIPSLYEYSGVGNSEPELVGVSNVGALHGKSFVNEGAKLLSRCGIALGGGGPAGLASKYNAISEDGSIVYFTALHESPGTGHVCASPAVNEVDARIDRSSTIAISSYRSPDCTGACAAAVPENAFYAGASRDGSRVFFTTTQPLLNSDADSTNDLYVEQVGTGGVQGLVQASRGDASDPTPGSGANVLSVARVSPDGSRVYFAARGVLTEAPNGEGEAAEAGAFNLYVYDTATGRTAFVANLLSAGVASEEIEAELEQKNCSGRSEREREECEHRALADVETTVGLGEQDDRPFDTPSDGRFLVFPSARDLTAPEDTSTAVQIFEYDAESGALSRVSVGQRSAAFPAGFDENGNTTNPEDFANIPLPYYSESDLPGDETGGQAVAQNGAVFFTSRDALTPLAVAGLRNVYEYEGGNVYLISPGEEPKIEEALFLEGQTAPGLEDSGRLLGTDEAGDEVFFAASGPLLRSDVDSQADWYVARVEGGFAEPASPAGCSGEGCLGTARPDPALPSPGSASLPGGGNLSAAAPVAPVRPVVLTRAERLRRALKACRALVKNRRRRCEARVKREFGKRASSNERAGGGR